MNKITKRKLCQNPKFCFSVLSLALLLSILILLVLIYDRVNEKCVTCIPQQTLEQLQETPDSTNTNSQVHDRAQKAIKALPDKNMDALADLIHPDKGVRFSAYTYVGTGKDLTFTAKQIKDLLDDTSEYTWGAYDGTGKSINLTFAQYYEEFVYDKNFDQAEKITYNEIVGQGNTINNIAQVYPDAVTVEFYISGEDPQYEGLDWGSLRLVFEQKQGTWYIVGIVHDQWTI